VSPHAAEWKADANLVKALLKFSCLRQCPFKGRKEAGEGAQRLCLGKLEVTQLSTIQGGINYSILKAAKKQT
jgi:hypothetical protein